jgi:hypothetical protein
MVAHREPKSKRGEIGWWSDPLPMQAARSRVRRTARIILESFWNLGRPPAPAGDDEATRGETLPAAPGLAEHIAKILFALDEFEDRRAADRADRADRDSAGLRSAADVFLGGRIPGFKAGVAEPGPGTGFCEDARCARRGWVFP